MLLLSAGGLKLIGSCSQSLFLVLRGSVLSCFYAEGQCRGHRYRFGCSSGGFNLTLESCVFSEILPRIQHKK